jgi:membrane protein DedA with SNARE-associated domain
MCADHYAAIFAVTALLVIAYCTGRIHSNRRILKWLRRFSAQQRVELEKLQRIIHQKDTTQ